MPSICFTGLGYKIKPTNKRARNLAACKFAILTFSNAVFPMGQIHDRWVVDLDAATHEEQTIAKIATASSSFARKRAMTMSLRKNPSSREYTT